MIARSWEVGIRHFDTAAAYLGGRSEEMVGEAIRQLGVRDKVIIGTKATGPWGGPSVPRKRPRRTRWRALRPASNGCRWTMWNSSTFMASPTPYPSNDAGLQGAMTQLKKEGRIRFAGVSTHEGQAEVLNAVMRSGFWDVVLVAFNYTMSENQALIDAMKLCASKGIGIVAMKTQAGGSNPSQQEVFGSDMQKSVRQSAVLKWVLQHPFVTTAIPGFTKFEHIDEDMPVASNLAFTDDERKFISNNAIKASLEFCQQCGECHSLLPQPGRYSNSDAQSHVRLPVL